MAFKSYLKNKYVWVLATTAVLIWRIASGYFSKAVEVYTESKVRNYAEKLIADSISFEVLPELESLDVFTRQYDATGKVSSAQLDAYQINKIRNQVVIYTDEAIEEINAHRDFGSIEIPLGYFFGIKYFLADGVRVPIQLEVIGNQDVELKMDTISKGINTTILEVYLDVTIDVGVVIPFQSKVTKTQTKIPLTIEIMNNEIPYYLGDLFNQNG